VNLYAILLLGEPKSGKSTLIRALTGVGRNRLVHLRSLGGSRLRVFVVDTSPHEMGMRKYPPRNFLNKFERKWGIRRSQYDVFIGSLHPNARRPEFLPERYIESLIAQGFDVRVAIIEKTWDGRMQDLSDISRIENFLRERNIRMMRVDASKDPNEEAGKIRRELYPQ